MSCNCIHSSILDTHIIKMALNLPKSINLLLFICLSLQLVKSSEVTFCDGESKIQKSRDQCSAGFTFGDKKPDCICIKGIYRLWTDTCETADGFADEVCTKLNDALTGTSIVGLKLAKDPINWSQTGVVCEKKSSGADSWDYISEKSKGITSKSNNIYVMNGKAFWDSKGTRGSICVKPATLPTSERICKYFKKDNPTTWKQSEVHIEVRKDCSGTPLKPSNCFGVLEKKDSECELSCAPKMMGRGFTKSKSAPAALKAPSANPAANDNVTNPADYRRHDNKFLNRKMLIYNIISQIEESPIKSSEPDIPYGAPKKTFELFHLMKTITTSFCPDEYVSGEWIDLATNLFYILHKGNIYQYEDVLSQEEYEWIKSILTTCAASIEAIELTSQKEDEAEGGEENSGGRDSKPAENCGNGGKATGYCNGTTDEGGCNYRPVTVASHRANSSFHYVPDVAWDIVDLMQVACFDSFNTSYRMFHVLEQAAERLFSLQIKNLWYYPGWSSKTKMKLLGAGADMQMHNFEVCIESAYDRNGKIPRLVRPTQPKYLRRKRSIDGGQPTSPSLGKETQVFCSKTKKEFTLPSKCPAQT